MTSVLPFLGDTELEVLSIVGAFLLILTHGAMAYCVKEKVVVSNGYVQSFKTDAGVAQLLPAALVARKDSGGRCGTCGATCALFLLQFYRLCVATFFSIHQH